MPRGLSAATFVAEIEGPLQAADTVALFGRRPLAGGQRGGLDCWPTTRGAATAWSWGAARSRRQQL